MNTLRTPFEGTRFRSVTPLTCRRADAARPKPMSNGEVAERHVTILGWTHPTHDMGGQPGRR